MAGYRPQGSSKTAWVKTQRLERIPARSDQSPAPTPSPSEWDPKTIAGLIADWDARHLTTDGTTVSAMQDQSGNGWNLSTTVPPDYVAADAAYGGQPSVLFQADGSGPFLDSATGIDAAIGSGPVTLFFVGHRTETNDSNNYAVITKSGDAWGIYAAGGGPWTMYTSVTTSGVTPDSRTPGINALVFNAGASKAYQNARTATDHPVPATTFTAVAGVRLGNYQFPSGDTFCFGGHVTRVLIYAGALSQADVEAALVGLGAIYGIAIGP